MTGFRLPVYPNSNKWKEIRHSMGNTKIFETADSLKDYKDRKKEPEARLLPAYLQGGVYEYRL